MPSVAFPSQRRIGKDATITGVYACAVAVVACLRYRNYWAGTLDMAIFDQASWRLAHGHATVSVLGRNIFFDHQSAVLLLCGGIYRIVASPYPLLVLQSALLSLVLPAMLRLAQLHDVTRRTAAVVTIVNAPLLAAAWFDFHPYTLAAPGIAWALVAMREKRRGLYFVCCLWVVLCRADLGIALLGLAIVDTYGLRKIPLTVGVTGILAMLLPSVFATDKSTWLIHYTQFGSGPIDALTHPWRLLTQMPWRGVLTSALILLLPVGFAPLWARRWLLAIALSASPLLLSGARTTHEAWFHYGSATAPLAIGALLASQGMKVKVSRMITAGMIAASLALASPFAATAPLEHRFWTFTRPISGGNVQRVLKAVPPDAVVSASDPFAARLGHRNRLYGFPSPFEDVGFLGPPQSRALSNRVEIVLVTNDDLQLARAHGFTEVRSQSGRFFALTRP